jgi:flagellar basal-body rod protein FlgB
MAAILPPLFQLLSARANFLQARHAVLSQNIANADTPRYQPKDLVEPDFAKVLARLPQGVEKAVLDRTRPDHLAGSPTISSTPRRQQIDAFEVAPSGNAVLIEEQLRHLGSADRGYKLATSIYGKYVALMRTAIGNGA